MKFTIRMHLEVEHNLFRISSISLGEGDSVCREPLPVCVYRFRCKKLA